MFSIVKYLTVLVYLLQNRIDLVKTSVFRAFGQCFVTLMISSIQQSADRLLYFLQASRSWSFCSVVMAKTPFCPLPAIASKGLVVGS
jgi:hypothetical protein